MYDPDTVRGPDVAFWSKERLPLDQPPPQGYPNAVPDLCVEIRSPHDRPGDIQEKVRHKSNEPKYQAIRLKDELSPADLTLYDNP